MPGGEGAWIEPGGGGGHRVAEGRCRQGRSAGEKPGAWGARPSVLAPPVVGRGVGKSSSPRGVCVTPEVSDAQGVRAHDSDPAPVSAVAAMGRLPWGQLLTKHLCSELKI